MITVEEVQIIIDQYVGIKYVTTGIGTFEELYGTDTAARVIVDRINEHIDEIDKEISNHECN